ncbi:MAG TPA: hypothetical protein VFW11_20785 [Cyclobacteriaceae bacterium]|nr:hypothetical protein [Cyclobacteriaceae bacterium]
MKIKLFILMSLVSTSAYCQDSLSVSYHKLEYWNSFATGILVGNSETSITGSFSTIHGLSFKRWRFGIGLGIEGYEKWRTFPFFGSSTFDFGKIKNHSLYVQMNAGYAIGQRIEKVEGATHEEENGGLMLNPMLGYRLNLGNTSLSVAAGYKLQRVDYSFDWLWGWPYAKTTMDEEFNRFIFQIGFGLH